jgi:hypothetical protein
MKLRGFFLLSLILVSSVALSVLAVCLRGGLYSQYWGDITKRPILSTVFTAAMDDVFPWSQVEAIEVEEQLHTEKVQTASVNSGAGAAKSTKRTYETVDDSYFDDALFVGDSRVVGLSEYCEAIDSRATFYAKKSLTIYNIRDDAWIKTEDGRKLTLWEALEGQQFSKIYIMVGINEIGTGDENRFAAAYKEVLDALTASQPNAIIFINSIMHVNGEKNENDELYNNTNINIRNDAIIPLANQNTIFYLNVNEAVDDEEGNLNSEWTSDGVHLKAAYYEYWHQYLLEHGIVV